MSDEIKVEEQSVIEQVTEAAKEEVRQLSPEELLALQVLAARSSGGTYKHKLTGMPTLKPKTKASKSWFQGKLVATAELSSHSWEEVHASNNVIRKVK